MPIIFSSLPFRQKLVLFQLADGREHNDGGGGGGREEERREGGKRVQRFNGVACSFLLRERERRRRRRREIREVNELRTDTSTLEPSREGKKRPFLRYKLALPDSRKKPGAMTTLRIFCGS